MKYILQKTWWNISKTCESLIDQREICSICTFSTAGSSIERSWTFTGMWALIFSFTASSKVCSWAAFTEGVSSSMVLLWRPRSLEREIKIQLKSGNPTRFLWLQWKESVQRWFYQDVVLYPKSASAKAVIKCWPESQQEMIIVMHSVW